ncbi:IspD/TarI family cytidylyltransferase, partial [Pontibaca methylaminivorans]|uniref:IspD/TarI family cytidylyltransferase n=1 Tax=Pontibaca methylaminivorans TaxID=515897 RepID=UPI002FDA3259
MTTAAIILAAGRGIRAGAGTPKQWRRLAGMRVADWSIKRFRASARISRIILVLSPQDSAHWAEYSARPGLHVVAGGANRAESVRRGLAALPDDIDRVLIHDGARPCLSEGLIARVIDALDHHPAA